MEYGRPTLRFILGNELQRPPEASVELEGSLRTFFLVITEV